MAVCFSDFEKIKPRYRGYLFLIYIYLVLSCLLLAVPAWGNATLYRGANPIGTVETVKGSVGDCVCIEDVGAILGFKSSRSGEELLLTRSDTRIRVIMNAVAAWRDIYLVSLKDVPFERDGRCWLDASSAVTLFQHAAGSGSQNRLRFATSGAQAVQIVKEPEPVPSKPFVPAAPIIPVAAPVAQKAPEQIQQAQPQPKQISAPQSVPQKDAQEQPKYETFRTDVPVQKTVRPSLNGGEIQCLRWSTSNGKIRAVVDASDGADPVVQMQDGVIHALFTLAKGKVEGLPGPYTNVKAEIKKSSIGAELIFTSKSTRVEKMVLDSPRRIVFDFFFPEGTRITANSNSTNAPAPSTVNLPMPTPANQQIQQKQTQPPAETAPIKQTPVSTPIPVATGTPRRTNSKKIVVVDPGHGGKDPGTSGNGITEKHVNLAIGLKLEKILKNKGFNVIMTRRTDVYLQLQERTDIANKADADVFVSVHVNALPSSKTAAGFEIYLMALPTDKDAMNLAKIENREYIEGHSGGNEASDRRTELLLQILGDMQQNNKITESTGLAETLFKAGQSEGIPMRRVAQAPFFVLRGAGMPAVLLETGFATNEAEAKLLAHDAYQERIAKAMAEGIANYLK